MLLQLEIKDNLLEVFIVEYGAQLAAIFLFAGHFLASESLRCVHECIIQAQTTFLLDPVSNSIL